jgi:hypothetical protein
MDQKNVATLQTCCLETKSAKKLVFPLKKALSLLRKVLKTRLSSSSRARDIVD